MSISVIYTPHERLPEPLYRCALARLMKAAAGCEIIIVWDRMVIVNGQAYNRQPPEFQSRHHMMYDAIMSGLEYASGDIVYPHCEGDCLYPPAQFTDDIRAGLICYTRNMWRCNRRGAWEDNRWPSLSGMCAEKNIAVEALKPLLGKARYGEHIKWCEPGMEDGKYIWVWRSQPYLDIRWGGNITGDRDSPNAQKMIPYWGNHTQLWERLGEVYYAKNN